MKKSPKFLRTIRSNKAPIILDQSFGMKVEPYSKLDPNLKIGRAHVRTPVTEKSRMPSSA